MGKTKVKIIDDAQVQTPKEDVLVARLKEELGVEETKEVKREKSKDKSTTQNEKAVKLKTKPRSKKYLQAISQVDRQKKYPLPEAVELAQKTSYTKFPGTLEVHINTTGQVIHRSIGKVNQSADEIIANIKSLYQTIGKSKITTITLSATMGPGVKVDLASI